MPGYVDAIIREIKYPHPKRPQFPLHAHVQVQYVPQPQLATAPDSSAPLSPDDIINPARLVGKLLCTAREVDSTLCVALSAIATVQNKLTTQTKRKIHQLLDYCSTNLSARLTFQASEMILHMHSDAGYNNESCGRSRSGGHLFWALAHASDQNHTMTPS